MIANSLKVESHASILNRLVHAQKTSVAEFFEHLKILDVVVNQNIHHL